MTDLNRTTTIEAAQLRQLISVSRVSLIASALLALLLAYTQRDAVAPAVLVAWLSLLTSVLLARSGLMIAYQRPSGDAESLAHGRLITFRALVLATGLVWGLAGWLLFLVGDLPHQMFLILTLAGLMAGGVVSFSSDLVSAILFAVSLIVPLTIRLFAVGDTLSATMGVAMLLFLGFMVMSILRINRHVYENIILHIEAAAREDKVRVSRERYRLLLSHLPVGIFHYDPSLVVTYCNDLFAGIMHTTAERITGLDMNKLSDQMILPALTRALNGELGHYEGRYRATFADADKWISMTCAPYRDGKGNIAGGISIVQDVTERKTAEETIRNLAFYDPLTNLPNRRLLLDRLQHAMASGARNAKKGALLFIDLDNFKTLNDTLGHDMGDKLLQQVAQRLQSCVRESDSVARLGGDEFVVMLEDLAGESIEAAEQTEIIGEKLLATLGEPYHLAQHEYRSTPSIGAVLFDGHQHTKEQLLKQADFAMYQAKKAGRNTLRFFDPEMQAAVAARIVLEADLQRAIGAQQFSMHYQLQVDRSGKPTGAEAVIRWPHPERGMLTPDQFLHVADETELTLPIGQWAIESVCAQLKAWQQSALTRHLVLAIKIGANHFRHAGFVGHVKGAVQRHGIEATRLNLQLTERALLENIENAAATMSALGRNGVRFSLADFGTGYSSLHYLKRLPLDQLKIDHSFIRDIAHDDNTKAMVRAIIAVAGCLDLEVVAEGVETHEQCAFLMENNCARCQGPLFGQPMPIEQFEARLNGQ